MSRRTAVPMLARAMPAAGVVDVLTGAEPITPVLNPGPLSAADAQVLTDRIRLLSREVGDRLALLAKLVDQARDGDAWSTLGYPSWPAYLSETIVPMRLPVRERREVVGMLLHQGLSTRAIGTVVSVDQKTVCNDRRALGAGEEDSSPVVGLDGKTYAPSARPRLTVVPTDGAPRPTAPDTGVARAAAAAALATARASRAVDEEATTTLHRAAGVAAASAAAWLLGAVDVERATAHARAWELLSARARRTLGRP